PRVAEADETGYQIRWVSGARVDPQSRGRALRRAAHAGARRARGLRADRQHPEARPTLGRPGADGRARRAVVLLHVHRPLRTLGFEPIASDVKEFVEQIGGDRFQAQDNPLTNIYNFGVHRHHRYITLSGHFWGASALVCNAAHYRSWPAEVRAAVDVAAREATAYQRQLAAAEDDEIMAKLDPAANDVIRLTDSERGAFIRAVQPVVEKYRKQLDAKLFAYLEA